MSQQIQLLIVGDGATGSVQVQGPVTDMRIVHWLLGEALRVCEREANARDAKGSNGKIVVAPGNALDGLIRS